MSSTDTQPLRGPKNAFAGFLIVAGIIATLALIPWAVVLLLLWIAGFQTPVLLVFLLYIICCLIVGSGLIVGRPGKGLSANFGG